jgi:hypothetical protein
MSVVCPVAYLNAEALRSNSGGRKKNAGRNQCDEQKFVFNHNPLNSCARLPARGFISPGSK